jgi:hypothetical protein
MYSLVLEKMSEIDFGEYLCEARNSLGSGKAHLQISGKTDLTYPLWVQDFRICGYPT